MYNDETFKHLQNGRVRIHSGDFPDLFALLSCDIAEGLGEYYSINANVLVKSTTVKPFDLVDTYFAIEMDLDLGSRLFSGFCASARVQSSFGGNLRLFQLILRPMEWKLNYRTDTRVFVELAPMEVARKVLKDAGLSDLKDECTTEESEAAELIVQYNETDLNFVSRLLEDEGRYFFYDHQHDSSVMVLCDGPDGHASRSLGPLPELETDLPGIDQIPCVYNLHAEDAKQTKSFRTTDYDFTKINADLATFADTEHAPGDPTESYSFPGDYTETRVGSRKMDMAAAVADTASFRLSGESNDKTFAVGSVFNLPDGIQEHFDFLVVRTHIRLEGDQGQVTPSSASPFRCSFDAVPSERIYRAPKAARRPLRPGVQTAEVVGPPGKEIHTDEYGRVKVQFHWDRVNKKDDKSSCWIRVATPWAGRGWGAITVPRIGNEVVVQFENGNPDRPIITGMLFNAKNMPPNGLPAAASKMGMKSNSTPGGGGANEFVMEDKKDAEMITMIGERDYTQTIKNDANINIGYEKGSPGSYYLNVHQDRIESVSNGDYNLGVDTGNRNTYVKTDDTVEVDGNRNEKVKNTLGNEAKDITINGTKTLKAESPDVDINGKTKTKIGSAAIEVDGTTIKISGKAEILLSVGGSSVKLDASGVTIAGPLVKIN